jgi:DNA processing protein
MNNMDKLDTRFALMLANTAGIGPVKYRELIKRFHTFESLVNGGKPDIFRECGLNDKQADKIRKFNDWPRIDSILDKARQHNVKIICLGDEDYPERLLNIYSPPVVLFVKGNQELLDRPSVAIVGSRTPTAYGKSMTTKIASDLAARGLVIISGLALGIDAEAHRASLSVGGLTGAIFGSGIDIIYPANHRDLAEKVAENGYLLSEFPFGTLPERHNFPRRNRIISGLSLAVVVVEAAARSGALVTADLAADQGKDVFAVPGPADSPKSDGTLGLIKNGAFVATSADDILQNLGWEVSQKSPLADSEVKKADLNLEPIEQKTCDLIAAGPLHFDELARKLDLPSSRLSAILLKLELAGLVVRRPGNYLARA